MFLEEKSQSSCSVMESCTYIVLALLTDDTFSLNMYQLLMYSTKDEFAAGSQNVLKCMLEHTKWLLFSFKMVIK